MVNATAALKEFDIDPAHGVNRGVQEIGEMINKSGDPLEMANTVIQHLGGAEIADFPVARITAKALVEQAIVKGAEYKADEALEYAKEKVIKLKKDHSFLFVKPEQSATETAQETKVSKSGRVGGKSKHRAEALALCEQNKDLTNAQLAKLLSEKLNISYSHGFYFAQRVFKRK